MSKCTYKDCTEKAEHEVRIITVDRDGKNSLLQLRFTCHAHTRDTLKEVAEDRGRRIEKFEATRIWD